MKTRGIKIIMKKKRKKSSIVNETEKVFQKHGNHLVHVHYYY